MSTDKVLNPVEDEAELVDYEEESSELNVVGKFDEPESKKDPKK
jgi:hypothetical protein